MSRIIIVTNPANDSVTEYLDAWQSEVVDLAKRQKDTFIFELNRKEVNKDTLFELIREKNPLNIAIAPHLYHNFIHQVCLGDVGACF